MALAGLFLLGCSSDQPAGPGVLGSPGGDYGLLPTATLAFVRSVPGPDGIGRIPYIHLARADGSDVRPLTAGEEPAFSPDGWRIGFRNGTNVYVIDRDGANLRLLGTGREPAWSPDGRRVVLATWGYGTGGLFVVDAEGSGSQALIGHEVGHPPAPAALRWPSWSPDGRSIWFVQEWGEYGAAARRPFVMNADGTGVRAFAFDLPCSAVGQNGWSSCPWYHATLMDRVNWSPDGGRVAASVWGGGWASATCVHTAESDCTLDWVFRVVTFDPDGTDLEYHFTPPLQPYPYTGVPDWSPDGRSLVFEAYNCQVTGCPMRLFVVDTVDGSTRQLVPERTDGGPDYWDHQVTWARTER